MAKPPPPPSRKPPPPAVPATMMKPSQQPKRAVKEFAITPWSGEGEGEKVTIYSESGGGKTTLAAMAPGAVFIGSDDGGRKIRHPHTGQPINAIQGVETMDDLRDVANSRSLWQPGMSLVLDTVTHMESSLMLPWVLTNVQKEKGGYAKNINDYGWAMGYSHLLDAFRLLLQDFDGLVRRGINVISLAQEASITRENPDGLDYLHAGPKLTHNNKGSLRLALQEWSDHVFRIAYINRHVVGGEGATKGKVVNGDSARAIFTQGQPHFAAKTRTAEKIPAVVSFESPADDSLWQYMFNA